MEDTNLSKKIIKVTSIQGWLVGFMFLIIFLVFVYLFVILPFSQVIVTCEKTEHVKFRYVGSGGLFSHVEKQQVEGNNYDGYMDICIKGKNIFGQEIER